MKLKKTPTTAEMVEDARAYSPPMPDWSESPEPAAAEVNPLLTIHRIMKGRYLLAITLGLLFGAALAYAGYKLPKPVYRSIATVRIRPYIQPIEHANERNGMMPMFDSFVESQLMVMRSPRVTDMAMGRDGWKALNRGLSPEAQAEFVRSLDVSRAGTSEFLQIAFVDKDPNAAMLGAKSVLESYMKVYEDSDLGADAHTIQILEGRQAQLRATIMEDNNKIHEIANQFGSDALEATYQYKQSLLNKIETELINVQIELSKTGEPPAAASQPAEAPGTHPTAFAPKASAVAQAARTPGAATTQAAATEPAKLTEDEIARQDGMMRSLLEKRREEELKIALMQLPKSQGGGAMTAEHKDVKREKVVLAAINTDIAKYVAEYVPPRAAPGSLAGGATTRPVDPLVTWEELRGKQARLKALYDGVQDATVKLGQTWLQIKALREKSETTQHALDEITTHIEQLNVESNGSGGRVIPVSYGDYPGLPWRDQRKQFAILGGVAGFLAGAALIALLAFLNQRMRSSKDAHGRGLRAMEMLGVLPRLSDRGVDGESAALAAHCVHGVRAALQVAAGPKRMAYAITSPSPGEGKTSLALALGMSFAATGTRTLMIDCDLVGGGLSSRVKDVAKASLMTTLLSQKTLTNHQLKAAVKEAQRSQRPLDETLIETGVLTREQIEQAVETGRERDPGLIDVIEGEPLLACVQSLTERRLSVLTLGSAQPEDVPRLSPKKLRRMIEMAKRHYDVILVDTGPVLGSLEAVMVGGQVDAVLMVVSRGTSREIALRAVDRLEVSGGDPLGIIFNRADTNDATFASSSSQTSISSRRSSVPRLSGRSAALREKYSRMGPLASAVAVSTTRDHAEVA